MKAPEKIPQSFLESFLSTEERKMSVAAMSAATNVATTVQRVNCPTCGSSAERYHSFESASIRTQCARCDYLMISCAKTGRVIESYAPSFSPAALAVM